MKRSNVFETVLQDLRFGARTLLRQPGFAAVAVLTLALGIGANAAIFSVLNAVLLRPLPWADPERTVMVWSRWTAFDKTWVADGEVLDYRRRSTTLTDIAAWGEGEINLTGEGDPERVAYAQVTANLFEALGVRPIYGRLFTPAEDVANGPRVVLLGHGLWTRRYGSDPAVLGRSVVLNGQSYQILAVMPRGFRLPTDFQNPAPTELWTPLGMDPNSTNHGSHGLYSAARLGPGATVAQASAELHAIARAMTKEGLYPEEMRFDAFAVSLSDEVLGPVRRAVWLIFGAVGFLLLIACANVANLLLARAEARQREIAVRAALGAGRARVCRQLLTESVVLAAVSGAVGLGLAYAAAQGLAGWSALRVPRVGEVTVDGRALIFTASIALVTSVIFGLAPAVRALKLNLTDALKEGGQSASGGAARLRFRNGLVVAEMALAVVLLIGAGLMVRSLWALQRISVGFDPSSVLTLRISLPEASYGSPEAVVGFYRQLLEGVRALPGVKAAGAVRSLPLASPIGDWSLQIEGYIPPPGTQAKGDWQIATDGYLEAMGERIVRGRGFLATDTAEGFQVGLVNEELARRYWPNQDPLGRRFRLGNRTDRPWVTVIGVVSDVRHNGITEVIKEKFYRPHSQWHQSTGNPFRSMTLVVKTATDPVALVAPIRAEIRRLDGSLPIANIRTMEDVVAASLSTPRFTGMLLGLFAALALTLSAVGIYGVLSYLVSRRTREIGIRVAIGAARPDVLRLVLGHGLALALSGVGLGLAAAFLLTRLMESLLHDVSPTDPQTFVGVSVSLSGVALLASAVPAWRATRVDPVIALKAE